MPIPFVMITLDKPRKLKFGLGAMIEFEQLTGLALADLSDDLSVETCTKVLWVMLRQEEKDITFEQVIKMVDENADNLTEIISLTTRALRSAFTGSGKGKNARTLAATNG